MDVGRTHGVITSSGNPIAGAKWHSIHPPVRSSGVGLRSRYQGQRAAQGPGQGAEHLFPIAAGTQRSLACSVLHAEIADAATRSNDNMTITCDVMAQPAETIWNRSTVAAAGVSVKGAVAAAGGVCTASLLVATLV